MALLRVAGGDLARLLALNPQIIDPDRIVIGKKIRRREVTVMTRYPVAGAALAALLILTGCAIPQGGDEKCLWWECKTAAGKELDAINGDPERRARALSAVKIAGGLACRSGAACNGIRIAAKVRQVAATVAEARAVGAAASDDYAEVAAALGELRDETIAALASEGS